MLQFLFATLYVVKGSFFHSGIEVLIKQVNQLVGQHGHVSFTSILHSGVPCKNTKHVVRAQYISLLHSYGGLSISHHF